MFSEFQKDIHKKEGKKNTNKFAWLNYKLSKKKLVKMLLN